MLLGSFALGSVEFGGLMSAVLTPYIATYPITPSGTVVFYDLRGDIEFV